MSATSVKRIDCSICGEVLEVPLVFRDRVGGADNCLEVTITPEMSAVRDHAEKHRQEDDHGDDG